MNGKPDNITEMVRRALAAQTELGMGEMVLKSDRKAGSQETAAVLSECERVVTASRAVAMGA